MKTPTYHLQLLEIPQSLANPRPRHHPSALALAPALISSPNWHLPEPNPSALSPLNMGLHYLKNTCKDRKKFKDAVLVTRMNLLNKQHGEIRRASSFGHLRKSADNLHGILGQHKKSLEKLPIASMAAKNLLQSDMRAGQRTFTTAVCSGIVAKPKQLKLEKLDKQNEVVGSVIEARTLFTNNKSDALIDIKLKGYLNLVREGRAMHGLPEWMHKQQTKRVLRVRIRAGNNSQLVRWLFKKRWWWQIEEEKESKGRVNFTWSQLKQRSFYTTLAPQPQQHNTQPCAHNHFPLNQYLGNKKALFYNMSAYYRSLDIDPFSRLPLTFHVSSLNDQSWAQFTDKYNQNKANSLNNIWILKPGENSNRGRGITIHQKYQQLQQIVGSGETFIDNSDGRPRQRTYIIQAYIDRPFLYNRRKFDIRAYMLLVNINNTVKGYWYSEGYIRTSSFEFQLNNFDTYVHLTNDAIQNNSEQYGKYEEGNKISYGQFQKYLDGKYPGCGYDMEGGIVPQMRQIAIDAIRASIHIVRGQGESKPVFEVFGLDFMIDRDFKPWLIEINTNPCLQTSCLVLEKVIPRMLDDAFKLSLDLLFPPPDSWPSSRKHSVPSLENKFQLIYDQQNEAGFNDRPEIPSLGVITEDGEVYEQKN